MAQLERSGRSEVRPYVRREGTGEPVVCLHSSLSSSKQWQPLMECLADTHEVLAPDLYGYGRSPDWPERGTLTLDNEVDFIAPVFDAIGTPFHLVGHSYGAAVALTAALRDQDSIKSVVIYEPVLFSLLFDSVPTRPGSDEIWRVQAHVRRLVGMKRLVEAAKIFVDYWSGAGTWDGSPEPRRDMWTEQMPKVVRDFDATLTNTLTLSEYGRLQRPTLILTGEQSPQSAGEVVSLLCETIPRAACHSFTDLGHMGPVTHPDEVNEVISEFVRDPESGT